MCPRMVLLIVVAMTTTGGCSSQREGNPAVDRLLAEIAAGGEARESASVQLAAILNEDPGSVESARKIRATRAVDAVLAELEPLVGAGSPTCGSWADNGRYPELRSVAELVIDVAGRTGAKAAIRRALALNDPYLVAWALRAAAQSGLDVDEALLRRTAQDDYARSVLYEGSEAIVAELPAPLAAVAARARSDMTQWLAYPSELGCQPRDLELMMAVDHAEGRYFVFRFRAGGGELEDAQVFEAGISGPWHDDRLADSADTFSDFERADSASPEEHLRRILALVRSAG